MALFEFYSSLVPFYEQKRSCEAAESIEDAVHDNRMFAKRTFYCIANGACELYRFRMYPSGYHSGPLGSDPVGFLDAGIPHGGRIMAVGADQDGNGGFGDFFQKLGYG